MSETLELVCKLVERDKFRVSVHAVQELVDDGLLIEPIIRAVATGKQEPAVLVTAYRPDPQRWDASFTRRRQR
ncbi:hypothetical protein [Ciceribacter sp. RN22]|uniref:hypothetical protein n=1 Tax=Ciceribacter sp. RN22 TaxID=2954932 RepID=UPI002092B8E3|nr:hypothetical protein [Ciceribacter sp. RN22]MCO6178322.1 hypothetical protein [Ciceribacter sp. RN22]